MITGSMFSIGITDHLEGPRNRPSADVYAEVAELVEEADRVGVRYAWFSEHHRHAHEGHMPVPLMFALHMAARTKRIQLGTGIICLNLHHPLDVAEQVAVADVLMGGRTCVGFGSGSTPEEFRLFGRDETGEAERHARFEAALLGIVAAWEAGLPKVSPELRGRCWAAVNSVGAARVAGRMNLNALLSHLRTVDEYRSYVAAYRAEGGRGLIAVNRPVFVGDSDDAAWRVAEPALRTVWRRFRAEGKIAADAKEPADSRELCGHPVNFIVGGIATVAREFAALHDQCPFDVMNVEVRWAGLSHSDVVASVRRLGDVLVHLG